MSELPEIDGYNFLECVGEGCMGRVYRALQLSLEREVAIKLIHSNLARREDVQDRFRREARNVARLDHPHVVLGIDCGMVKGRPFFVMEFLTGGTLEEKLASEGPLSEEQGLTWLTETASALRHAETTGMLHLDIKPGNLMIDGFGKLKLTDLGLSVIAGAQENEKGKRVVRGTPHYISPEQIRQQDPLDTRADIYALGATFFHLLTGKTPFQGTSSKEIALARLRQKAPDPRTVRADLSSDLAKVLTKMLDVDREKRFESAALLVEQCESLQRKRRQGGAQAVQEEAPKRSSSLGSVGRTVGRLLGRRSS